LIFRGLGEKRKAALLEHFGTIDKLRAASVEKIAEVPGFGAKLAEELRIFMRQSKRASDFSEAL
jgi:excinuclease ABC subunit C